MKEIQCPKCKSESIYMMGLKRESNDDKWRKVLSCLSDTCNHIWEEEITAEDKHNWNGS